MRNPVPWWKTDLGDEEIRLATEAIRNRQINQGPVCAKLEEQLGAKLGGPNVVMTASGSTGLLLALMAVGVKPGDEVIVPAFTFIASAHAVLLAGAKVKLVDVKPDEPVLDARRVEEAITERTTAIIAVHLSGFAVDMAALQEIAAQHNLKVIEDSAQAFGSADENGWLGTQSDVGVFSMSMTKLITTGEGGFACTRDAEIHERLLKLRNQGVLNMANNVFDEFGFNFRFNDIQAGVGLAQLAKMPEKMQAVRDIHAFYRDQLADIPYLQLLEVDMQRGLLPLWSQVLCQERDRVAELLAERGVQTQLCRPSLADSPHLSQPGDFQHSRFYARHGFTLPSGPDQTEANLQRTVDALREIGDHIPTGDNPPSVE